MKFYNRILLLGATGFIGKELRKSKLFSSYQFLLPVRNEKYLNQNTQNITYIDIIKLTEQEVQSSDIIIYMLDDITLLKNASSNIHHYIGLTYLEFIVKNMTKGQHIIFLSSRMVYDKDNIIPVKEESKLYARDIYSSIKIKQEKLIIDFSKKNKFQYSILRASNVYTTNNQSIAKNIINIFIKDILMNNPLSIYGTGNQLRDYVNIKYLLNMIQYLIEHSKESNILNIGSNSGLTINQIIDFIQKCTTEELIIKKVNIAVDESAFIADCTKTQKMIPYTYNLYEDIEKLLREINVK